MTEDTMISTIVQTYKDVALIPSPTSAILRCSNSNLIDIYSTWSIPDVIKSESTKFTREFLLDYKCGKFSLLSAGIPNDTCSVSLRAFTKTGNRYAVFRKIKKNNDSIFLEVWNTSKKESTFDLTDSKEHGTIQESGAFGSFEWSSDERYLLYIADAKQKSESFFKDAFCHKPDTKSKGDALKVDDKPAEETTKGEEFLYRESWGEQYTTAHHTVLCIFEVSSGKVEVVNLDDKYPNISVAQATWGPSDECIVFIGLEESPSRLGLRVCDNRRSAIFSYNVNSKVIERLTPEENMFFQSPVFSPNFEMFVYLQNKAGGPHKSTKQLMKYDWKTKEISTLIDIVDNAHGDEFAGVHGDGLSSKCWSKDSRFFFFDTVRRSFMEIYCVDMVTSKIQRIDFGNHQYSCCLLCVQEPYIVASVSSENIAPSLMIGHFSIVGDKVKTAWSPIEPDSTLELKDLCWKMDALTPSLKNETYPNLDIDIITMWSKEEKNGTLIIFPHGGPHVTSCVSYVSLAAALARLGFIVCKVNYRGSLGFGENGVKSLLGNVGTQDISDVVDAIDFLKKDKSLDIQRVVGLGGSHGGFIVGHLLGQYPDLLKAAVMRNPVTDLTSMVGGTDIPDWCWIESGCSKTYDALKTVDPSVLEKLWEMSPIRYIKNVKSPTLLQLGKVDMRVPPYQGLLFHRQLKAQKVPTKAFYYDDNHSLSKVGVSSDAFVHMVMWFKAHSSP